MTTFPPKSPCPTCGTDLSLEAPASLPEGWKAEIDSFLLTVRLLLENTRGCIIQHHGRDVEKDGWPGWFVDAEAVVAKASSMISASPQPPSGWKDISTAPKDGTPVIVTDGAGVYGAGWWHSGEEAWLDCDGCRPTHWMPLPSSPQPPESGKETG